MVQPLPLPVSLSLAHLLNDDATFVGCSDLRFSNVTDSSLACREHTLFVAVQGRRANGAAYVDEARKRGAVGILTERPIADCPLPQCVVPNVRRTYSKLCLAVAGQPQTRLQIAGVTGTNGKTTTAWMLRSIMARAGLRTGLLGTVEYSDGCRAESAGLTTPDSQTLADWLYRMVSRGATHAAMEVSSHALDQDRAAGLDLDCGLITNVTQDHFDYHGTFESYRDCKSRLIPMVRPGGIVALNIDDPSVEAMQPLVGPDQRLMTCSLFQTAELSAKLLEESISGTGFRMDHDGRSVVCRTRWIGRHNIQNALLATAAALHWGVPLDAIGASLELFQPVPGRMERVAWGQPFEVFVDYAHTPDALARSLATLRSVSPGRIICVFGAGGDRDRSKRALLGQAAATADIAFVTSDNPRSEPPLAIMHEIAAGMTTFRGHLELEPDRETAIRHALDEARPGDTVVIAGKGHETTQVVNGRQLPFDDRQVARQYLELRTSLKAPVVRRASA